MIDAYVAGVNAGLSALQAPPFEYALLRVAPAAWTAEDSLLVSLSMFIELHDDQGLQESARGLMRDTLPPALYAFLTPPGTEWDAPLVGPAFAVPPIPGPEVFDVRKEPPPVAPPRLPPGRRAALTPPSADQREDLEAALGSNNWAVAGTHTATGAAIVADDMHLNINVPNIWYRASMAWKAADGDHRITGVTLPGAPTLVVGSTGRIAWAFTNSQGDWHDLVVIEPDPSNPARYLTPQGPREYERHREVIRAKGAPDETMEVLGTVWGPVVDADHLGRRRALRWTAYYPEAVNIALLDVENAADVDEAVARAARAGIPPQNFVCGDAGGRIAWTIIGRIPRRVGLTGREPESWADGAKRWEGWLEPEEHPRVVDPPSGKLWSANSRMVDGEMLARVGETAYDLGARQQQIRDALLKLEKATMEDMRRIQLDDRALFLARWRDLLLRTLDPAAVAQDPRRAEFRRLVEGWGGHASVDSAGYRLVRAFRGTLAEDVFGAVTARCKAADARFDYVGQVWRFEGPLWALATERPAHLLPARFRTWDEQLLAAVDRVIEVLLEPGGALADRDVGRAQHHARAAPAQPGRAVARALARHAAHPAARRLAHAALPEPARGRLGTDGRLARPRGRRLLPHAGRPERPSALGALRRRAPGVGHGRGDTLPARPGGAHAGAAALDSVPPTGRRAQCVRHLVEARRAHREHDAGRHASGHDAGPLAPARAAPHPHPARARLQVRGLVLFPPAGRAGLLGRVQVEAAVPAGIRAGELQPAAGTLGGPRRDAIAAGGTRATLLRDRRFRGVRLLGDHFLSLQDREGGRLVFQRDADPQPVTRIGDQRELEARLGEGLGASRGHPRRQPARQHDGLALRRRRLRGRRQARGLVTLQRAFQLGAAVAALDDVGLELLAALRHRRIGAPITARLQPPEPPFSRAFRSTMERTSSAARASRKW